MVRVSPQLQLQFVFRFFTFNFDGNFTPFEAYLKIPIPSTNRWSSVGQIPFSTGTNVMVAGSTSCLPPVPILLPIFNMEAAIDPAGNWRNERSYIEIFLAARQEASTVTLQKRVTMIYGKEIRNLQIQTHIYFNIFTYISIYTAKDIQCTSTLRLHFVGNSIGRKMVSYLLLQYKVSFLWNRPVEIGQHFEPIF